MERRVIMITGCTASGKGALARLLARQLGAEILSVDSMKVYRRMDIGTAKPPAAERAELPHHLIDVVDPWESFSVGSFVELADRAVEGAHARGRPVIAVGGTILYLKCFYEGMMAGPSADPEFRAALRARAALQGAAALHRELEQADPPAAARIHPRDLKRIERALEVLHLTGRPISAQQREWTGECVRRPDWDWTLIGLRREKDAASRLINERVRRMVGQGLEDEARAIWSDPRGVSSQAAQAVGYAEWFTYFRRECEREDAVERIKINSRQLAKHQRTWLRRMQYLQWIDLADAEDAAGKAELAISLIQRSK